MGHYFPVGLYDNPRRNALVLVLRFCQSLLLSFCLLGHKKFTDNLKRECPLGIGTLIKLLENSSIQILLYPVHSLFDIVLAAGIREPDITFSTVTEIDPWCDCNTCLFKYAPA